MYADDTSIMCKANDVHELQSQLNACLSKVAAWFKVNKLTLNIDKTKFMICGTKRTLEKFHDVKLTFNGSVIERVDEFKYLGVKLDSSLSWSAHIDYLCKNVSKRTGIIKRVKIFFLIKLLLCYQMLSSFHILIMEAVSGQISLLNFITNYRFFIIT